MAQLLLLMKRFELTLKIFCPYVNQTLIQEELNQNGAVEDIVNDNDNEFEDIHESNASLDHNDADKSDTSQPCPEQTRIEVILHYKIYIIPLFLKALIKHNQMNTNFRQFWSQQLKTICTFGIK